MSSNTENYLGERGLGDGGSGWEGLPHFQKKMLLS